MDKKLRIKAQTLRLCNPTSHQGSIYLVDVDTGLSACLLISPLLSNLYMRRFVLGWKKLAHEKRLKAYIINYADDLVICCHTGADEALVLMRNI